jgi:uncharacterized protein YutE (UPF0331/DUF86 family)
LLAKIALIRESLGRIQTRRLLSLDEFLNDADARDVVVLDFQNAIQGCIDIADHLIADQEWGVPGSAGEAIDKLSEHGVIAPTDGETYKSMIRFRNLMVQAYAKTDYRQVYSIMKAGIQAIERYIDAIAAYCKL